MISCYLLPSKESHNRIYILTPVNLQLVVHYIKYKQEAQTECILTSKRLPEAAKSYSITRLDHYVVSVINIASFSHLLKRVDFDAIVDKSGTDAYY